MVALANEENRGMANYIYLSILENPLYTRFDILRRILDILTHYMKMSCNLSSLNHVKFLREVIFEFNHIFLKSMLKCNLFFFNEYDQ